MRHRNWRHRGLCHRGPAGHADVMKPIATPIIGGMLTSTIHVLVITPVHLLLHEAASPEDGPAAPI